MINYNIMNIILYKTAFNEWQNRIKNIHQEFRHKYRIKSNGDFLSIYFRAVITCSYCKHIYYHSFNYRNTTFGIGSLNNKCKPCMNVDLPKNYW